MGKGDLRSRRGKIYNGSHGKKLPGRIKKAKPVPVNRTATAPARGTKSR